MCASVVVWALAVSGSNVYEDMCYRMQKQAGEETSVGSLVYLRQVAVLSSSGLTFGLVAHQNEYNRYPLWKVRRAYYWAKRGYSRPPIRGHQLFKHL